MARYFTAKLLARPGALVSENLLAIRLGIDRGRSEAWPDLLNALAMVRYQGAFADGYPRWWQVKLLDWWQETTGTDRPLQRFTSAERVEALIQATSLKELTALEESDDSPGARVWSICVRSGIPVDPSNGFALLAVYGHETWQDQDYLCLEEAKRDPRNPRLSPIERNRISALLKSGSSV